MHSLPRSLPAALFIACAVALTGPAFASPPESSANGSVDFGQFKPADGGRFVEINIPEGLLKFSAALAAAQEPQAGALLRNLRHVRVNVIELNDANRQATLNRVQDIRRSLDGDGWIRVVNVTEPAEKQNVEIFAKMHGENAIEGLVIMVVEGTREVVLVNVVGNIKPEQIAMLADKLNIAPLKKVHWSTAKKS